jgi:N utilization substance protein A
MKTLDMRFIRYLNLFEKVTRVRIQDCFPYNNVVIFCVPYPLIHRAMGEGSKNIRILSEILGKKVRMIPLPRNPTEFIANIVAPVKFKGIEINDKEIIINAGKQSKAALIGRNKVRLEEIDNITKEYFGKDTRII